MVTEKKKYSTFAVMFYINKGKTKKNGMCTIMGRISVSGDMTQFSTKIDILPKQWDSKAYRLRGKNKEVKEINHKLETLTSDITLHHHKLVETQNYVTAELLKNKICDIGQKKNTLLSLYAEHNTDYEKMVGVTRAKSSFEHYKLGYRHLNEFIQYKYDVDDIALTDLNLNFIENFDLFLRGVKRFKPNTISGAMVALKRVIRRGINQGTLRKDPFVDYTPENPEPKPRYMTPDDLHKMMTTSIKSKALCRTRDMFIFSTFTGLAYIDVYNLKITDLHSDKKRMWITTKRQKTKSDCYIPLLEIPRQIIAKYESERKNDKLFDMRDYGTIQENLIKVIKLCGITTNVSYHQSRHNFGTLITLLNGVPLESIAKMMGYNDLKTTEIYARLTSQKVNEDMKLITKGTKRKYKLFEDKTMPITAEYNYFEYKERYEKKYNKN